MKILVIEDEPELAKSIGEFLKKAGHLVEIAVDFKSARNSSMNPYDCVLVDILLPDGNGLDIIRELKREYPETGIIITSAKDSLQDKIKGLDLGADDYLAKPFHLAELNARVNSLARRKQRQGSTVIEFNEIRINPDFCEVLVCGRKLELTKKEFEMLVYFMINKNRVLSKQSIIEHLWEDIALDSDSYDFVYTHIKNLRKKILLQGGKDYIRTVYGLGYSFKTQGD
jgi:DNA-binding response OmpR family regulator